MKMLGKYEWSNYLYHSPSCDTVVTFNDYNGIECTVVEEKENAKVF